MANFDLGMYEVGCICKVFVKRYMVFSEAQ